MGEKGELTKLAATDSRSAPILIWVAIASGLGVAAHRLAIILAGNTENASGGNEWVSHLSVVWLMLLLLAATRLWRSAAQSRNMVHDIISSVRPDALMLVDEHGKVLLCNPAAEVMFGYSSDEMIGNPVERMIEEESADADESSTGEHSNPGENGDRYRMRFGTARHKDGSTLPLEIVAGDMQGMQSEVLLARDITQRREVEAETHRAREAAESSNATKSQFLAAMSHELRTPLNAVIGFADVLSEEYFGELNEKQKEYVGLINTSGKHLLDLINDILDISKVEAGKMELVYDHVDVSTIVNGCLAMIRERCTKHGIALTTDGVDTLPTPKLWLDERKLKQIVFNLLSNAAKFTPDGGTITVSVCQDQGLLCLDVTDSGIGIPSDQVDMVFEEFHQVAGGTTGKSPGTGLGLPLTRKLCELQGGTIGLKSDGAGLGSTFSVALPMHESKPPERSVVDGESGAVEGVPIHVEENSTG